MFFCFFFLTLYLTEKKRSKKKKRSSKEKKGKVMMGLCWRPLCVFSPCRSTPPPLQRQLRLLLWRRFCFFLFFFKPFFFFSIESSHSFFLHSREWVNFLGERLAPLFLSLVSLSAVSAPLLLWWWSSPGPTVMGDLSRLAYFLLRLQCRPVRCSYLTRCAAVRIFHSTLHSFSGAF